DAIEPSSATGATAARRGHILLIEDEPALRTILLDVLTGLGHTVDEAATGEAGMHCLERQTYDVIALDLRLPDIDGKVIWRWLHPRHPDVAARVVFMTGDTMSPATQSFLEETGCPALSKPLAIDEVAGMVDRLLASR